MNIYLLAPQLSLARILNPHRILSDYHMFATLALALALDIFN